MRTPITPILLAGIATCGIVLAFAVTERAPAARGSAHFRDAPVVGPRGHAATLATRAQTPTPA